MPRYPRNLGLSVVALFAPGVSFGYALNGYTINDGPVGTGRENLVVSVHGWNSGPTAWANSMNGAIVSQLTASGRAGQWDTWSYDWSDDADSGGLTPSDAILRNAQVHGQHLADWVIQQTSGGGYEHIHLMGHSLGGRVIETAAVKLHQAGLTLHSTFFDAYTPKDWNLAYGENSDYAEHYYNDDFFIIDTQDNFTNAHNVDVSDDGGPGQFTTGSGHSWPYNWYRNSVNNGGVAAQGYGFALSKEFVGDSWQPPANRPAGNRVDLPGQSPPGTTSQQRRVTRERASYNSLASASDELTLNAGQTVNLNVNTSGIGTTNYLDFRFDFASRDTGNLTVQVDGNSITHVQEAFSLDTLEWSGKLMIGSDLSAGNHTISFSLAGGDSVTIDDVSLGLYGALGAAALGDTDFDGDVDLSDLSSLASYYGTAFGMDWDRGDFDADGDVDLNDLSTLASAYGAGTAQAFSDFQMLVSIPEPTLPFLGMSGWCCLLARHRSRS